MSLMIAPDEIDLILFDLDNTLYHRHDGLWAEIDKRILAYVCHALGLAPEEARIVQKRYWRQYGTTLMGLMCEHGMAPQPYLEYVHDFDVSRYLQPNPELATVLAALPQRKAVFTNATSKHARNVLSTLGILSHFEKLIGVEEVGYIPKPQMAAYERCLALLDVPADRCLFIEDSAVNLPPARVLGMKTVLLGAETAGEADFYLERIEHIGRLFTLKPARPA